MTLQTLERLSADSPNASVIWLHGLGADGHDFADIVPMLELPETAAIRFIFPHAPIMPVSLNGGQKMPAWYDIYGIGESFPYDLSGIKKSQEQILELIAQENKKGIPCERIILAGFSQGGAIVLHTGLRIEATLAGILALSTYLVCPDHLMSEKKAPDTLKIMMMHGSDDTVVDYEYGKKSATVIIDSGYKVDWKEYLMPHSVCQEQLLLIGKWISQCLGIRAS
ncbi:phospholipase/carboxylesterase family protein [hydrothermal vent metagenome]|uniref:Phospholipase/carboxylesterase family protein n=1 Tax=hydrothermal vent metagenome TaxID=652676 RepID=A0A3B0YW21_9ZZZZ